MSRLILYLFSFLVLLPSCLCAQNDQNNSIVPITTKSAEARDIYKKALIKLENMHGEEAMQDFHKAVQHDPDFALANIIISFPTVDPTVDPVEQVAARDRANAAKSKVSRGEQLIIEWI